MLEEIGHSTFLSWVAYIELEQEEQEEARKQEEAKNKAPNTKTITF